MFGGVGKSAGWATILGAVGVVLGTTVSAQAADLGGNCCADLEERVAELEATTARKGNRKVSLTVSGWVNEAVFWWDDGSEQNVYVGTNDLEQSRFRFTGEAKIDKDWSAGYILELGTDGDGQGGFTQNTTNGLYTIKVRKSNWWIKSKTYGQVAVGLNGSATYHLLDDADGANTRNFSDAEAGGQMMGGFFIRSNGAFVPNGAANLAWKDLLRGFNNNTPGQAGRREVVRYDSPTFVGFTLTAAWGADDIWDVALTYKNDIGDFSLLGRVGYGNSTDPDSNSGSACGGPVVNFECEWAGAAGTVMHKPTGLYVYGGYGWQKIDSLVTIGGVTPDDTSTTWFIQPGIEHKWHPLGKTTIFGEYRKDDAGANENATGTAFNTRGADITYWAGGVVQNVEAAAMDLYVIYRHVDGDFTNSVGTKIKLDDFDMVMSGAMIRF